MSTADESEQASLPEDLRSDSMPPQDKEHVSHTMEGALPSGAPVWVINASLLWNKRRKLARTVVVSFVLGIAIAFALPKHYESSARIMPPANAMGGAALIAALAGHSGAGLGSLGVLAGGLLGGGGNTSLFMELLRSGTVSSHLIDRFDLQHVYHKRYRVDTAKYLARRTRIVDDKKSGIISLTVTDNDPVRARDIAQAYLDELNILVNHTNTSSAHQERQFIEGRLQGVKADLARAQQQLSEFSSTYGTIDIKEQTRALVDAGSRIQAQLIVEEAELDATRKIYGDENVRVRSSQARIAVLKAEIARMSGSSSPLSSRDSSDNSDRRAAEDKLAEGQYPPLRQLPRLAVPYADLYREVRVQESVYELLTQQYEIARIQEAKDIPVVSVIDVPGIPEKKSFPPRLLMALAIAVACVISEALLLLIRYRWSHVTETDPRKVLAGQIGESARSAWKSYRALFPQWGGAR